MLPQGSDTESCSINSLDSVNSKIDEERNNELNRLQLPLPSNILTRTSTIISAIRDDNRFAKLKTQPDLSFDPNPENIESSKLSLDQEIGNPEEKGQKPAVKDTGEYNKYDLENKPPDGTFWGWMSAVCVLSINCFSWGSNSSFGVYLNYYVSTDYFPGARMEQYVMIGGLGLGFSFMVCTLANSLVRRYYYKIIMLVGTAIIFISYWLASIAKTVVQLIMFQGFLLSIGYALAAGACFVILPTWFLKKRSLAQGIATAGAGLAGIIFSRPVDVLIANEGKKGVVWALRMQALVCGFMLVISIILIRCHRSLKVNTGKSLWKESTEFIYRVDLIRQLPMICIILWNMVYGVAYTILLFSLSSYASSIGLTYKQGSNITTVQSVAQCIGRPLLGTCSDAIGRANTTIIFTFILGVICFVYWIFIETYSELIGFAFVAGFIMGVNWVNFGPMTADIVGGGDDLLAAISILTFTGGTPLLVAELIGLKLRRDDMEKEFLYCQILVGVACLVSVALLMPFREWKIKRILNARRNLLVDELEEKNINFNYSSNAEEDDEEGEKRQEEEEEEEKDREQKREEEGNHITEIQNTLQRLDWILEAGIKNYIIRMFYPIAV